MKMQSLRRVLKTTNHKSNNRISSATLAPVIPSMVTCSGSNSNVSTDIRSSTRLEKSRNSKVASSSTSIEDQLSDDETNTSRKSSTDWTQTGRIIKLMLVVSLPVITLIAICTLQLTLAVNDRTLLQSSIEVVEEFLRLDALISGFQLERGTSAALINSRGTNVIAFNRLPSLWAQNDQGLQTLTRWPPDGGLLLESSKSNYSVSGLMSILDVYRSRVVNGTISLDEEMAFYSEIIEAFIDWSLAMVITPNVANVWALIAAMASLLQAANEFGKQRALGTAFFACDTNAASLVIQFLSSGGIATSLLDVTFSFRPEVGRQYNDQYVGSSLEANITMMVNWIVEPSACENMTLTERADKMNYWQSQMTLYINLLASLRQSIVDTIRSLLADGMMNQDRKVTIYSVVLAVSTLSCLFMTIWYAKRNHLLIRKMREHALRIKIKSNELAAEKRRSDHLLYQMIRLFYHVPALPDDASDDC